MHFLIMQVKRCLIQSYHVWLKMGTLHYVEQQQHITVGNREVD